MSRCCSAVKLLPSVVLHPGQATGPATAQACAAVPLQLLPPMPAGAQFWAWLAVQGCWTMGVPALPAGSAGVRGRS